MIETIDQRLQEWIGRLAGSTCVFLDAPADMVGKTGVSLYLMELSSTPAPRGIRRPPLSISLHYLVTTWLGEPAAAHRLLDELLFAAMEEKEFDVEPTPLPVAVWQALGVQPRPSFLLKVPLRKPRPEHLAPRVQGPISVRFGAMHPFRGRVTGPGQVPIMAATVTLPSLQLTTCTDHDGRFYFAAVPQDPPITHVAVNARGREVPWPVPADAGEGPLSIELTETQI